MKKLEIELREKLADIEHQRWSHWQEYMFDCAVKSGDDNLGIRTFAWPTAQADGWERQIATPYAELSEAEKQSDRNQVDRYWPLLQEYVNSILTEVLPEVDGINTLLDDILKREEKRENTARAYQRVFDATVRSKVIQIKAYLTTIKSKLDKMK